MFEGEKGEGFAGTVIKDTWTITMRGVEIGDGPSRNIYKGHMDKAKE